MIDNIQFIIVVGLALAMLIGAAKLLSHVLKQNMHGAPQNTSVL